MQQSGSFFNQGSNRDDSPTIGTAGVKADVYGTLVGADRLVTDKLLVGAALGYNQTSYRLRKGYGHGKIKSYLFGLYWVVEPTDELHVNGTVFSGYHDFKGKRNLLLPGHKYANKQAHRGHHVSGSIEVGRDIALNKSLSLTPYGSLGGLVLQENGYTEAAQGLNPRLRVNKRRTSFVQTKVGAQLSQVSNFNGTQLYIYGKLGYTYKRHLGYPQGITASFADYGGNFNVRAYNKPQNMVNPGCGVIALLANSLNLSATYNGEISTSQYLHQAQIRLDYRF